MWNIWKQAFLTFTGTFPETKTVFNKQPDFTLISIIYQANVSTYENRLENVQYCDEMNYFWDAFLHILWFYLTQLKEFSVVLKDIVFQLSDSLGWQSDFELSVFLCFLCFCELIPINFFFFFFCHRLPGYFQSKLPAVITCFPKDMLIFWHARSIKISYQLRWTLNLSQVSMF